MDGDMSVSLWCAEAEEDQEQEQGRYQQQTEPQGLPVRAPWDPAASGPRVIQRLLQVEERYLPSVLYVSLIRRDPERREELAKWTLEVCCNHGCSEAVFPLSMSLMDRFLSTSLSSPASPYCLAAACILIASKLSDCEAVSTDSLCAAAEFHFLPTDLREMERIVLATLRWDTAAVTPQDFLPHFLSLLVGEGGAGRGAEEQLSTLRRHSDTLAAMCSCDSRFLGAPPSLVAAASLNCALRGLGARGTAELELMSEALAELCRTDLAVLRRISERIEEVLNQRLRRPLHGGSSEEKEVVVVVEEEEERPGTPTDMRDVDL
ncbi:cyclin Dx [Pholidichthys leucotaenia]